MDQGNPLPPGDLYQHCDPDLFDFETTRELENQVEILGQDRAVEAIHFGTEMGADGYNLYVLGQPGTGRHAVVRNIIEQKAAKKPVADDWCYVNNFADPKKPHALRMPAGQGNELRRDIAQLVEEAYTAIPAAFESEDYQTRRQAIEDEFSPFRTSDCESCGTFEIPPRIAPFSFASRISDTSSAVSG